MVLVAKDKVHPCIGPLTKEFPNSTALLTDRQMVCRERKISLPHCLGSCGTRGGMNEPKARTPLNSRAQGEDAQLLARAANLALSSSLFPVSLSWFNAKLLSLHVPFANL